jgi:hypothetical protein
LGENLFEQSAFLTGMLISGYVTGGLSAMASASKVGKAMNLFKTMDKADDLKFILKGGS